MVAVVTAGLWWVKPDAVEVPRPLGQIRITLPDTTTSPYKTPCGSQFRIPNHAKVELRNSGDKDCLLYTSPSPRD